MRLRRLFTFAAFVLTVFFTPHFVQNASSQDHLAPMSASAVSHARVVSLALVHGIVAVKRPESAVWVHATANMPIEEGFVLATEKNSFAEVQFENGSTLRLGEFSRIEITQLSLNPHSGRVNHFTLVVGVATINVMHGRRDEYVLNASDVSLTPDHKAEFRADLKGGHLRAEVFSGRVQAQDAKQSDVISKNRTLVYDYRNAGAFQESKLIQRDWWDNWVRERDREADMAAYRVDDPANPNGLLYGWDDLVPFGGTFPDSSF